MRANDGTRTAGEVLIDQLVVHGARHVFCVPGESYIAALDAFYDRDIAITVCRHESGVRQRRQDAAKIEQPARIQDVRQIQQGRHQRAEDESRLNRHRQPRGFSGGQLEFADDRRVRRRR